MKAAWTAVACFLIIAGAYAADEPETPTNTSAKPSAEERKRQYTNLQKEMEATMPAQDAPKEEISTFLEQAIESYGKFVQDHPRTPEGFEAAVRLASWLTQFGHPRALAYSELAVDAAPAAGVDVKRVAYCHALVASNRLLHKDLPGARDAIEKIQPLDPEMYAELSAQVESLDHLRPGKAPFPIETKDVSGKDFSLAALKGKVVVLNFWAGHSKQCMDDMPDLVQLNRKYKDKGLELVGVNLDKNKDDVLKAINKAQISWTTLADGIGEKFPIGQKFRIETIPANFVVDQKGVICAVDARGEQLEKIVTKLLEQKP
jgi:thiol-disulfide isomerase/thioredoxin